MSSTGTGYRSPYDTAPGSSTPSPSVTPHEGWSDLWGFVLLSLMSSAIIAVVGLVAWFAAH